jgi:hypothetical protein
MRASHALGIALRIDPDNADAKALNDQLANGQVPVADPRWKKDPAMADVRALAVAAAGSKATPDQVLAAYLYDLMIYWGPSGEDMRQKGRLMQAGIHTNWVWADLPEMTSPRAPGMRVVSPPGPFVTGGQPRPADDPPPAVHCPDR